MLNLAMGRSITCSKLVYSRHAVWPPTTNVKDPGKYQHYSHYVTNQDKKIAMNSYNTNVKMIIDITIHGFVTAGGDDKLRNKVHVVVLNLVNKYFTQDEIYKTMESMH